MKQVVNLENTKLFLWRKLCSIHCYSFPRFEEELTNPHVVSLVTDYNVMPVILLLQPVSPPTLAYFSSYSILILVLLHPISSPPPISGPIPQTGRGQKGDRGPLGPRVGQTLSMNHIFIRPALNRCTVLSYVLRAPQENLSVVPPAPLESQGPPGCQGREEEGGLQGEEGSC